MPVKTANNNGEVFFVLGSQFIDIDAVNVLSAVYMARFKGINVSDVDKNAALRFQYMRDITAVNAFKAHSFNFIGGGEAWLN